VRALLEVGTGFHPELTGRENIYLNGAMLGMKRGEIDRKFDEITAFAEIDRFLDTPIKHYSSGMYVRLAFSVAAHLEPEILLVDEVLAVGDAAFQKKCLGRMGEVSRAGRTVLFVSHNMAAVRGFCGRALWIDSGRVAADGTVDEVVSAYMERISNAVAEDTAGSANPDELQIRRVILADGEGRPTTQVAPGDDLIVEIQYFAPRRFLRPQFWVSIVSQHGSLIAASMLFDGRSPESVEGPGQIRCRLKALPLVPQPYSVRVGVRAPDGVALLAPTFEAGAFTVAGRMADYGFTGDMADVLCWEASPVILPYEWHLPGGDVVAVPGLGKRAR
jgi:lipopolysaccharide transport system ATP-binding protein